MIAILLVGGLGSRLRPLTLNRPKALMPLWNRPFLLYQLDILQEAGIVDVVMAAGNRAKQWESLLAEIRPKKMKLHFVYEKTLLGTGGAIRLAYEASRPLLKEAQEPVLILNGDILFDLDVNAFLRFHKRKKADCTIALSVVEDPSRFGLIGINHQGKINRFIEKPKYKTSIRTINAGAYIFNSDMIEKIPTHEVVSVERQTYPAFLKQKRRLFGFKTSGYWNDIGTHSTYLQAHRDLLTNNNRWTKNVLLRKRADRDNWLSCGKGVRLGVDSIVKTSVIMDNVTVGKGCKISGAIIGRNCVIGDHSEIKEGAVLGDGTRLSPYSKC
jgi:mannose-1-phosphate guanylyltransferase